MAPLTCLWLLPSYVRFLDPEWLFRDPALAENPDLTPDSYGIWFYLRYVTLRCWPARLSLVKLYSFCSGVSGAPSDNNIMLWNAVIFGPHETPFEDGTFKLTIVFTEDYPNKPPSVRSVEKRPQNTARICKLCKEPRNRYPAWRNRFFGIDSWAP